MWMNYENQTVLIHAKSQNAPMVSIIIPMKTTLQIAKIKVVVMENWEEVQ